MNRRYLTAGLVLVSLLIGLILTIRGARGVPKAIEVEPWKILGHSDARVFIVEFSDFACPYCNKIRPVLDAALKTFPRELKVIFKQFPLSIHPPAQEAAEASECAGDQEKFWPYHDLLFERTKEWYFTKERTGLFEGYAEELGLDRERFRQCLESRAKEKVVSRNKAEGRHMFVSGTPTLLLNGRKVLINHDPQYVITQVRQEIERTGSR